MSLVPADQREPCPAVEPAGSATCISQAETRQACASDLLFLMLVVFLSVVPYLGGLGFYSDDWAFLAALLSADQSLPSLWAGQVNVGLLQRPAQIVYQLVLFKMFGLTPAGYHVVNAAMLASTALLLYLVLCELRLNRPFALALPAVYILLPNYSTDRFWFAAFGYPLSMAFFLVGVYAYIRAVVDRRAPWVLIAVIAFSSAALGMEVVIPLTIATPAAIWYWSRRMFPGGLEGRLGNLRANLLLCSPVAAVVPVILYKAATARGARFPDVADVAKLAIGSLAVNFGTYGIAFPHTVAWSVRQLPFGSVALGAILAGCVFVYLSRRGAPPELPRLCAIMMLVGAAIFVLSTGIFLSTLRIGFWSTGVANRVWIAAALGSAVILVSASGWVSARVPGRARGPVFAGLIASLCLSGYFVNTALSGSWVAAWRRQGEVLRDIQTALPSLRSRTTLILYGVCPYVGVASVFEAPWSLSGALQVLYGNPTLRADVVIERPDGRFRIAQEGVWTQIYGVSSFYPYGRNLLLFDDRHRTAVPLTDSLVARTHLSERTGCPEGVEGRGTTTLPIDVWYHSAVQAW